MGCPKPHHESVTSTVEITIQIDGQIFGTRGNECHKNLKIALDTVAAPKEFYRQ